MKILSWISRRRKILKEAEEGVGYNCYTGVSIKHSVPGLNTALCM
jgi:hypothetical protein